MSIEVTAPTRQKVSRDTLLEIFLGRMSHTLGGRDTLRLRPRFQVARVNAEPNWTIGIVEMTTAETAAYYEALEWTKGRYELDDPPQAKPKRDGQ
ncbi:MAG: hypothetical protein ACLP19_18025 [Xanthobacteraceae bacterium]